MLQKCEAVQYRLLLLTLFMWELLSLVWVWHIFWWFKKKNLGSSLFWCIFFSFSCWKCAKWWLFSTIKGWIVCDRDLSLPVMTGGSCSLIQELHMFHRLIWPRIVQHSFHPMNFGWLGLNSELKHLLFFLLAYRAAICKPKERNPGLLTW